MKRKFTSLLVTALGTGALAFVLGCAPAAQAPSGGAQPGAAQPKSGGVMVHLMNQAGDPPSFDLHQESTSATTQTAGPLYDNLIMFNPLKPDEIVPDLAEKWELAPDGKTYTFHLVKGVKFHNGNPFTAADVKFTLERVMNPPKGVVSPRRDAFGAITSIETPDDYTVKVNLKRPNPSLLPNLAQGWMAIYDKEWVESKGQDAPKKEMMGTGPFKLKDYTRGTSLEVERNPSYWVQGRPYLDGVKTLVVPDPGTRLAAFRTGQVMTFGLNASDFKVLQQEMADKLDFESGPSLGFGSLYMNTKRKPFDDARVREALNLLVDRYAAIQVLAQGEGMIGGFMLPGGPWSLPEEEIRKFSGYAKDKATELERAKKLMAEAGLSSGFDATIMTRNSQGYIDLSVFIIDQLKKLNINAKVNPVETTIAYDLARKADYDLLTWTHGFALDDPDAVYGEFYNCEAPRNWSHLCTAEVDQLFERQSQEIDPAKRSALVLEMERKAIPTATKIITHWSTGRNASWKFVRDYVRHPSGYNNIRFRDVWFDK